MTDTLEAPPVISANPQVGFGGGFDEALKQHDGADGMPVPKQEAEPEVHQDQVQEQPKVEAQKEEPKNPWDKLNSLKVEDKKNPEVKDKGTEQEKVDPAKTEKEEPQSPQAKRWGELRSKETELDTVAKPRIAELEAKVKELEEAPKIPKETQDRLEFLEQKYAVDNLVNNTDYQKEVLAPWEEADGEIEASGKHAGLEASQVVALKEAVKERDGFQRNKNIRSILQGGKVEDEQDLASLIATTQQAANRLHKEIWPKDAQYQKNAMDIANAAKGREVQQSAEQTKAQEMAYQKAHDEVSGILSAKLDPFLKAHPDMVSALKNARPATDDMHKAYDSQAGAAFPYIAQAYLDLLSENAELKRVQGIKNGVKPKADDGRQPVVETEKKVDLGEALQSHFQGGFR